MDPARLVLDYYLPLPPAWIRISRYEDGVVIESRQNLAPAIVVAVVILLVLALIMAGIVRSESAVQPTVVVISIFAIFLLGEIVALVRRVTIPRVIRCRGGTLTCIEPGIFSRTQTIIPWTEIQKIQLTAYDSEGVAFFIQIERTNGMRHSLLEGFSRSELQPAWEALRDAIGLAEDGTVRSD